MDDPHVMKVVEFFTTNPAWSAQNAALFSFTPTSYPQIDASQITKESIERGLAQSTVESSFNSAMTLTNASSTLTSATNLIDRLNREANKTIQLNPALETNVKDISQHLSNEIIKAKTISEMMYSLLPSDGTIGSSQNIDAASQRFHEVAHPDQSVSMYESKFPLNRPLSASWLYGLMFLSTLITILSIAVFLKFANVEFQIKLPQGDGVGGLLESFGSIPPTTYAILVGGSIVAGAGVAYAIYKYS